jgi:hypothetical protein
MQLAAYNLGRPIETIIRIDAFQPHTYDTYDVRAHICTSGHKGLVASTWAWRVRLTTYEPVEEHSSFSLELEENKDSPATDVWPLWIHRSIRMCNRKQVAFMVSRQTRSIATYRLSPF